MIKNQGFIDTQNSFSIIRQKGSGFTLIELLVVVAVLAILTTLVVISVDKFRNKASDSAVIAQMKTIIDQAGMYVINKGSYTDMCDPNFGDSVVLAALNQIKINSDDFATNGGCESDSQEWVAWAKLKGGSGTWCADSTNFSGLGARSSLGNYCE